MVAPVRVGIVSHPGNGYWRLVRHLLGAREDALLVAEATSAAEALAQLAALPTPPDLLLASPLVPAAVSPAAGAVVRALAAACPPARIALFGHSYEAGLDALRWDLGVPSYLCWDELMAGDTLLAPRKLAGALAALLAGVPVQTDRARLAGHTDHSQPAPPPTLPLPPLSGREQLLRCCRNSGCRLRLRMVPSRMVWVPLSLPHLRLQVVIHPTRLEPVWWSSSMIRVVAPAPTFLTVITMLATQEEHFLAPGIGPTLLMSESEFCLMGTPKSMTGVYQ